MVSETWKHICKFPCSLTTTTRVLYMPSVCTTCVKERLLFLLHNCWRLLIYVVWNDVLCPYLLHYRHFSLLFIIAQNINICVILYEPCIILQYVYKPTICTKLLWLDFIIQYTLYIFRTVSVHLQEQSFISCMSYLVYADTTYSL